PMRANGEAPRTINAGGIPDSIRIFLAHQQQCFRFAISLGCNSNEGGYFDNASLAFVDGTSPTPSGLGSVAGDIWQFTNDAFPANETAGLPGTPAFDTTTALIKTGLNNAPATGDNLRFDIPGDSSSVTAADATVTTAQDPALTAVRVDLVFRIL